MNNEKPILVTGSHRSGTTWTGKMLAAAPNTAYIHEPFNQELKLGLSPTDFNQTFKYITESDSEKYKLWFGKILKYNYPLFRNLTRSRSIDDILKLANKQSFYLSHKLRCSRPIVKDPIAIFSAEWIHENFNTHVLIMVRNSFSFCSSLKIKKWNFNFGYFLEQPLLMEKYLHKYEREIREYTKTTKSIIEQAILLWNCIHETIMTYQKNHPDWLFIKHEDLSLDPVHQFEAIYKEFGLEFTDDAKLKIIESSGEHNPTEQQKDNEFVRNSKKNIDNWKIRLTDDEITMIKAKTAEISSALYPRNSWSPNTTATS